MRESPWENEEMAQLSLSNIDQKFLPGTEQEVDFLEHELELRPSSRILDLGCGAGRHSIELASRGYQVVGVDISGLMLKEARQRAAKAGVDVTFVKLDLADLESRFGEAGSFHAAICLCESGLGALGREQRDLKLLRGVHRVLKPGCKFIFTGFNAIRKYRHPGRAFDYTSSVVHWKMPINGGKEFLREDNRCYTPSELRMMLELAGFSDIKVHGCSPGNFAGQQLGMDDIEMMLVASRPSAGTSA